MSSPMSVEHTLPPPPLAVRSLSKSVGGPKPKGSHPVEVELSVFNILNIFRCCWFLSRASLLANTISAQKAEDRKISWVEFSPPFHSHLVKCAVALVPCPVPRVKRVMFVFILELLNGEGHEAFFELQKGGCKANNAQKEKQRLAWKRSCVAKRERDREAAKAAKLPPHERQCEACGRKFKSCKCACKHKCSSHSKVVRAMEKATEKPVSRPAPPAKLDKPATPPPPHHPTDFSDNDAVPAVTDGLQDRQRRWFKTHYSDPLFDPPQGRFWAVTSEEPFSGMDVGREDLMVCAARGWYIPATD